MSAFQEALEREIKLAERQIIDDMGAMLWGPTCWGPADTWMSVVSMNQRREDQNRWRYKIRWRVRSWRRNFRVWLARRIAGDEWPDDWY